MNNDFKICIILFTIGLMIMYFGIVRYNYTNSLDVILFALGIKFSLIIFMMLHEWNKKTKIKKTTLILSKK